MFYGYYLDPTYILVVIGAAHLRDRFVEGESGICKIFPYAKPHGNDGERGGRTDLAHEWHI